MLGVQPPRPRARGAKPLKERNLSLEYSREKGTPTKGILSPKANESTLIFELAEIEQEFTVLTGGKIGFSDEETEILEIVIVASNVLFKKQDKLVLPVASGLMEIETDSPSVKE